MDFDNIPWAKKNTHEISLHADDIEFAASPKG
jgi:hypothetical protein